MRFSIKKSACCLLLYLCLNPGIALDVYGKTGSVVSTHKTSDFEIFDVNRLQLQLVNNGALSMADGGSPAMYWPDFASGEAVCCFSGVWAAGKVNGKIKTACAFPVSEWQAGIIDDTGEADNTLAAEYRIYHIQKDNPMTLDWIEWPAQYGAPWKDRDNNGIYDAYAGDTPLMLGDEMVWYTANDANVRLHDQVFRTDPLMIEGKFQLWGHARQDYFGDVVFAGIRLIHRGMAAVDSCFIGIYADVEIGSRWGDLIGTDSDVSMMYAYNEGEDERWGDVCPAMGVMLLQGAQIPCPGDTVHSFDKQIADCSDAGLFSAQRIDFNGPYRIPESAEECFYLLAGRDIQGDLINNPITGMPVAPAWYADGDPVALTGWVDQTDALSFDRRVLLSTGPFEFAPGDTQDVIVAFMAAQAETSIRSVTLLKENARGVKALYENGLQLAEPPPCPKTTIAAMDHGILLSWDDAAEAHWVEDRLHRDASGNGSAYQFQGYNVYQLETETGDGAVKKIATFDLNDGILEIRDRVYEPEFGETVMRTVQRGEDSGIQRYMVINRDRLRDETLINHRPCHFAVTAYAYNPHGCPRVLESVREPVLTAMPGPAVGEVWRTEVGDTLEVTHEGGSQGRVTVEVINPGAVTGHEYEVGFEETGWYLKDITQDQRLLTGQCNQSGDLAYSPVDGLLVRVAGPEPGIDWSVIGLNSAPPNLQDAYHGWGVSGKRWISGYDLSDEIERTGMGGGLFTARDYLNLSAEKYVNIRLDFAIDPGPDSSNWSRAYVLREDLDFACTGIGWFPGTLWHVGSSIPRQLNIAFVENHTLTPANSLWDMGWQPETGDFANEGHAGNHEMIWLMESLYDAGLNQELQTQDWRPGRGHGIMYAIWPRPHSRVEPYAEDFSIYVYAARMNAARDHFYFSTRHQSPDSRLRGAQSIDAINVFPNPYKGANVEERHGLEQFVRFTHLPRGAILRIYTVLGDLIRKIEHESETPYETWNLRNEFNIPVASGVYLIHIDCGSLGEKVLKLAVVLPEERLPAY